MNEQELLILFENNKYYNPGDYQCDALLEMAKGLAFAWGNMQPEEQADEFFRKDVHYITDMIEAWLRDIDRARRKAQ